MTNASFDLDVLGAEDIATLRDVFDRFCLSHQRTRSDRDVAACADVLMRLYQSGVRDHVALTRACETALGLDTARHA